MLLADSHQHYHIEACDFCVGEVDLSYYYSGVHFK